MKRQSNKTSDVFIVISGYKDDNQIRFIAFDYKDAFAMANKIVHKMNRKIVQKDKLKVPKFYTA